MTDLALEHHPDMRERLVARWLQLTRQTLPVLAETQAWPIRLDHCFMRVFLDHAVQGRWDLVIPRPAIRHAGVRVLQRAVTAAERVLRDPGILPEMNARSLGWRRRTSAGR